MRAIPGKRKPLAMRTVSRLLPMVLCSLLLLLSSPSAALADRGMVPISDVSVYGPGQKAIIAWDGEQEILVLSTDAYASGDSAVLEILPLPSEPQRIEKGDFASFIQVQELINTHFPPPKRHFWDVATPGAKETGGVEILFHEKIGAHDITVIKANDAQGCIQWAEDFLARNGIEYQISSHKLEVLLEDYIEGGINYFVFDLIELTSAQRSIEPIIYEFQADYLYFPLKISSLASGETRITLFLLTHEAIDTGQLPWGSLLPTGMEIGRSYDEKPIQFKLDEEELKSIDRQIAGLMGDSAWLTALNYIGSLARLNDDLKIYTERLEPVLVFDYYGGGCASRESSAQIFTCGNEVLFSGLVVTPTPCYELRAELTTIITIPSQPIPTIMVNITAHERTGAICIECLGEVPFRGKVVHLNPGRYEVSIRYQGNTIAQEVVDIPNSTQAKTIELAQGESLEVNPAGERPVKINGVAVNLIVPFELKVNRHSDGWDWLKIQVIEANDETVIGVNSSCAWTRDRIKIKDSQLYLETPDRAIRVWILPDEITYAVVKQEVHSIELKITDHRAVYAVDGVARAKLLWLIPLDMKITTTIDARSGEVLTQEKPWWGILCQLQS